MHYVLKQILRLVKAGDRQPGHPLANTASNHGLGWIRRNTEEAKIEHVSRSGNRRMEIMFQTHHKV